MLFMCCLYPHGNSCDERAPAPGEVEPGAFTCGPQAAAHAAVHSEF